jgi:hypothetical protein
MSKTGWRLDAGLRQLLKNTGKSSLWFEPFWRQLQSTGAFGANECPFRADRSREL